MIGGGQSASSSETVSYSQFVKDLKNGKIKDFSIQPANGVYSISGSYKKAKVQKKKTTSYDFLTGASTSAKITKFSTTMLQNDPTVKTVENLAQKHGAKITTQENHNLDHGLVQLLQLCQLFSSWLCSG